MANVAEMTVAEQLATIQEIAFVRGWSVEVLDSLTFLVTFPAQDGSSFGLLLKCEQFPTLPPALHWCDPKTKCIDQPKDTPRANGNYFHGNGVVCAPFP